MGIVACTDVVITPVVRVITRIHRNREDILVGIIIRQREISREIVFERVTHLRQFIDILDDGFEGIHFLPIDIHHDIASVGTIQDTVVPIIIGINFGIQCQLGQ